MQGHSSDDEPETACPVCKGAGFVYADVPPGDPDFGRAVPCQCTRDEYEKERLAHLERYSNLGSLTRLTFDNLLPQGRASDPRNSERFSLAYKAARDFAQNPEGWLVLTGVSGCGKTHLAAAIANSLIARGVPAFFVVVPDLLDHLRSTFSPSSEISYDELFEQVREAPVLVLDDLGRQTSTPWAREKLYQVVNHRFNTRMPTVFTMNTPIEELEDHLRTRLTDPAISRVYLVEGREESILGHVGDLGLKLLSGMTFENFDSRRINLPPEQRQNLGEAFRRAKEFAEGPDGWLVLLGEHGCGKTHLAAAIANHRVRNGQPAHFVVVPDFLDHLRLTFSPDSRVGYDELFEQVRKTPLLILDDFGEQSGTPWAQEKLYQIINYRYNARLPTVITTCLSLDEIESRISSRLADPRLSLVFNIRAPDYRIDHLPSQRASQRGRRTSKADR